MLFFGKLCVFGVLGCGFLCVFLVLGGFEFLDEHGADTVVEGAVLFAAMGGFVYRCE